MFPTFYKSPAVVTTAAFVNANGLMAFRRTVLRAGGTFAGKNDLGAIVFRGSRELAASIAAAGYDVSVHNGPAPDDALKANSRYHARTGEPTAWAAVRCVGVEVRS